MMRRPESRCGVGVVARFGATAVAAALLLVAGCGRGGGEVAPGAAASWEAKLVAERGEKDREFKRSPTSPMAGVARTVVRAPGGGWVAASADGLVVTPEAPAGSALSFAFASGWRWRGMPARAWIEGGGKTIEPGVLPDGALFRVGRFTLATYAVPEQLVVIEFDPERAAVCAFKHLLYFAPDPAFVVQAKVEKVTPPEPVTLATSRNLEKRYFRWARLRFDLAGTPCVLTAFKMRPDDPADTSLFVPFADRTSGAETYGSGRFMDLEQPAGATVELDFNRAYNPLCNYSPAYNCPLPPSENRLAVAVRAGEKTYPH